MRRAAALAAAVLVATVGGYAAFRLFASPVPLLRADDPETVAIGHRVYDTHCASCHGDELEGQPDWMRRDAEGFLPAPPHDASGHTWHHPDAVLFDITRNGVGDSVGPDYRTRMPAFGGRLPDDAIVQALSYLKSRWPEDIRRRHDEMNARTRAGR